MIQDAFFLMLLLVQGGSLDHTTLWLVTGGCIAGFVALGVHEASTREPMLPLELWRAGGLLMHLEAPELAFTRTDASTFLAAHGVTLSHPALLELYALTEGWPVALRLTALSMQGHPEPERLVPEIIKRLLEAGVGKIAEGPENIRQFVSELKLPKEIISYLLVQIDETKNGVYRIVSKEIRDFLQETNFGEELTKILTKLSFEVKTEIRFIPNDAAGPNSIAKPDIRTSVNVRSDRNSERAPRPDRPTPTGDPEV